MKKTVLALSAFALILSLAGVASAASVAPLEQEVSFTPSDSFANANVTVTFIPAKGEKSSITIQDTPPIRLGINSTYTMEGSSWTILYGHDVVELHGAKAKMIGYGTAQVRAFKSNGAVFGVYTFDVRK